MTKQTVFPCITFKDAKASFEWLERALGAERLAVYEDDDGRVAHAELRIGSSTIMAGDERAGSQATPPGVSVVYVVVDDADAAYRREGGGCRGNRARRPGLRLARRHRDRPRRQPLVARDLSRSGRHDRLTPTTEGDRNAAAE